MLLHLPPAHATTLPSQACFSVAKRHHFDGPLGENSFFTGGERQGLILRILTSHHRANGAWLKVDELKASGQLIDLVPLNNKSTLELLLKR